MERIWGPFDGFYLAAYAAPAGDADRFCSYAKVCWTRPHSYWEADCAFKIFAGEHHRSLEAALATAALEGRNEISRLPRRLRLARRARVRTPVRRMVLASLLGEHFA